VQHWSRVRLYGLPPGARNWRARNPQAIARILQDLQGLHVLDVRSMDAALYDETGMPR
jgi:hypothetical protein